MYNKFNFAKDLAMGLNESIPDLDYKGTIRTFGYPAYTNFHYGFAQDDNKKILTYDKKGYNRAIRKILEADGVSPLHLTLDAVGRDWYNHEGKIAVIIISDGNDMGEEDILAAEDLKARYGKDICIYTILIGNSPSGKKVMNRIAMKGQCGINVNGDTLLDHKKMEKLVKKIFLTRGEFDDDGNLNKDCNCDEDGDGVPDSIDECPGGSIPGVMVGDDGCWKLVLTADVLFDFDKTILKPKGIIALRIVKKLLNKYKFLDVQISGHTDNFGSMNYNINLSKRRAEAGRDHLLKQGIDPKRMSISWHSYTIPVATNDNATGRALNRRLEFKFNKRQN
jgi:OmpA-OmpF porin, OOP family